MEEIRELTSIPCHLALKPTSFITLLFHLVFINFNKIIHKEYKLYHYRSAEWNKFFLRNKLPSNEKADFGKCACVHMYARVCVCTVH